MIKIFFKYIEIFFLFFIASYSFAQIGPSYYDRQSFGIADSNLNRQLLADDITGASEGIINPEEYFVGPGDKLLIVISGLSEKSFLSIIDQEGFLYINTVGLIDLRDKTLFESKQIISAGILKSYKNVDISISLLEFRKIRISIIGNVKKQTNVIIPSNTRLMDLFSGKDILKEDSDIRNIIIKSRNGSVKYYDLLSFYRSGDLNNNPFLNQGDAVLIQKTDKTISVLGSVKYPGIYEFRVNEQIINLIELCGGFSDRAFLDSVEVIEFDENFYSHRSKYYSIDELTNKRITISKGDKVIVREKPDYMIDHLVTIKGFVKFPGVYKILKNKTTLQDIIINEAGGFLKEASIKDASVYRTSGIEELDLEYERLKVIPRADMSDEEYDYLKVKSRERKGIMVVNFEKLFLKNDLNENLILRRGDVIEIPEIIDYITILGQVVNPGKIIYKNDLSVEDYIKLAGGFAWRAIEGDVRVIKAKSGEWIEEDDVESLEPGDIIWIPEETPPPKFWVVFMDSLSIVAQLATILTAIIAIIVSSRK